MFKEEAQWISNALRQVQPLPDNNRVANLGSSTAYFRKQVQPHINNLVIAPLEQQGWQVLHIDMKQEEGVDIPADVTDAVFAEQFARQFGLTICTNMLEHVTDIPRIVKNLAGITASGGYILVTVPYKYKMHHDPIDNGFRPTPGEIITLFSNYATATIATEVIVIHDKANYRIKRSRFPGWGYRERIAYYLGKRHKVSGVLLRLFHDAE